MRISANIFVVWILTVYVNGHNSDTKECYSGAYRVINPPFNDCSGFRNCEPGYFCLNGIKYICQAGSYGETSKLHNSSCSGLCSEGFYCPAGSISSKPYYCGDSSVYCPSGTASPISAPNGYYTIDTQGHDYKDSEISRSNILICPTGHYCVQGIKHSCPSGVYGNSKGLFSANCSGSCPEGWYCPIATTQPFMHSCGATASRYCPLGADHPLLTAQGYYATQSHLSVGGGFGSAVICPPGSYCVDGVKHLCPPGRYGSTIQMVNSSCTGMCTAGYYCPAGSISSKQIQCMSDAEYCPVGSAVPIAVSVGHYSVGFDAGYETDTSENVFSKQAYTSEAICPPGSYCLKDGIKRLCPAGRYGAGVGIASRNCDGYCALGHFCPEGSSSATQHTCSVNPAQFSSNVTLQSMVAAYSANLFCPPGSSVPQTVHVGYYSVLGDSEITRGAERRCEPGYFCDKGRRSMCEGGRWGSEFGEIDSKCTGVCSAGYYCPLGSISPTEVMCGDSSRYCPEGVDTPTVVSPGYYSVGGNDSTRVSQVIAPRGHYAVNGLLYVCPAGHYGATEGLTTSECSGHCLIPGYYCPVGSISPVMRYCGDDNHYCPPSVVAPLVVHKGFYTADYRHAECPPGKWRETEFNYSVPSISDLDMPLPSIYAQFDCQLCANGTYKAVVGNDISLCVPCGDFSHSVNSRIECSCSRVVDALHVPIFNVNTGSCDIHPIGDLVLRDASEWTTNTSLTRYQQFPCDPGHYCVHGLRHRCAVGRYGVREQETDPLCSGQCAIGYYCLEASTSAFSYPCGGADWICAGGSSTPIRVKVGYYSNEDAPELLRSSETVCPKGYYCPGDGRRYPCAAGTYTDETGTVSAECKGVCDKGHYCHVASPSKTQFKCGNATVYCPRGSSHPFPVHDGFYSAFTGVDAGEQQLWDVNNSTASVELPCEPGYYCQGGIKQPCPPGYFGWRHGMTSNTCGGKCAAGYYCPSYLPKQHGAPPFTLWPMKPHVIAASPEFECGSVNYYCPLGTVFPHRVGGGNYSFGGGANNRTRHSQAVCAPGSYCTNSITILCPPGRYGSTYGLADPSCTAGCPAGFYCPSGSAAPIVCPANMYSTGLVALCSECPGGRLTALPCQNEKGCCFRN